MTGVPVRKEVAGLRPLKEHASYACRAGCNKSITNRYYDMYDAFAFACTCSCESKGKVRIAFDEMQNARTRDILLFSTENRRCCPLDKSPSEAFVVKGWDSCKPFVCLQKLWYRALSL